MNLKKILTPETVWVDLRGSSKQEVIEEMVSRLYAAGKLKDSDEAFAAVMERESKMSTGMQNGVAIPHGKTDAVQELVAAVGLHKEGVAFDAMDGEPSRIFIMTISPVQRTGPHMQFLAEVSRLLSRADAREKLLDCTTHAQMYEILTGK